MSWELNKLLDRQTLLGISLYNSAVEALSRLKDQQCHFFNHQSTTFIISAYERYYSKLTRFVMHKIRASQGGELTFTGILWQKVPSIYRVRS